MAEVLPDVPGRGFLWGPLAEGAIQPLDMSNAESGRELLPRQVGLESAGAMVTEMPSLSGSSDLSSAVISGYRKALVWADCDGGLASPSIFCRC